MVSRRSCSHRCPRRYSCANLHRPDVLRVHLATGAHSDRHQPPTRDPRFRPKPLSMPRGARGYVPYRRPHWDPRRSQVRERRNPHGGLRSQSRAALSGRLPETHLHPRRPRATPGLIRHRPAGPRTSAPKSRSSCAPKHPHRARSIIC